MQREDWPQLFLLKGFAQTFILVLTTNDVCLELSVLDKFVETII